VGCGLVSQRYAKQICCSRARDEYDEEFGAFKCRGRALSLTPHSGEHRLDVLEVIGHDYGKYLRLSSAGVVFSWLLQIIMFASFSSGSIYAHRKIRYYEL
jgi:hypothetical protein